MPDTFPRHALARALADEYRVVHGREPPPMADEDAYRAAVRQAGQSALCLSGGGVRSAAFCLGVVQGLAKAGLLARFDYLSTVSGGGFTGSWLTRLIHEKGSAHAAQTALAAEDPPPELTALRRATNYLTPQPGLFSADSWTTIVLYLRNMLLTWFAFAPLFLLAALLAIFYRTALWEIGRAELPLHPFLLAAAACLALATTTACISLPSHRLRRGAGRTPPARIGLVVWLSLAWAFLLPFTLARWFWNHDVVGLEGLVLPATYFVVVIGSYLAAALSPRDRAVRLYRRNLPGWLTASLCSAALIWVGLILGRGISDVIQAEVVAVFGPLWLILAAVLQTTVHVGLRREAELADLDREWLARLSAVLLRPVVMWTGFALCTLTLPRFTFHADDPAVPVWLSFLGPLVSGSAAAWLGKQALARVESALGGASLKTLPLTLLLQVLSALFAIGLACLIGFFVGWLLGQIQLAACTTLNPPLAAALIDPLAASVAAEVSPCDGLPAGWNWLKPLTLPVVTQAVLLAGLGFLLWRVTPHIDVNRFSLHGVYRNRLARAFLGAAHRDRQPDPFTGFDPRDNIRLAELAPAPERVGAPRKLFHVVNMALNLTQDLRVEWAERKAAPFTATALACGSPVLNLPEAGRANPTAPPAGAYVRTRDYAGREREAGGRHEEGMTLATAMTISGAAVSPNWGYHSSPVTAFLMTLFNVRLGAWLPNPGRLTRLEDLRASRPRNALMAMLGDLLGRTTDRAAAINLSDGGHFDNLGLYEMLRRRCRLIVVVDAGQDGDFAFADLGNALRKARIDLAVEVAITPPRIASRAEAAPFGFAVGRIAYHEGGAEGRLIYLKPAWLAGIPADVRAYGAASPDFPHESTLDQWFSESQFESYRALGACQAGLLTALAGANPTLASLFDAADAAYQPADVSG